MRRYFPIAFEAAEVIEPDGIETLDQMRQPPFPPGIAIGTHRRPVVQWIAPTLAGGAEVVRRHARHDRRLALRIQQVLRGVGPDVGRVVRDEDRRVADDAHTARVRMAAHTLPLLHELPLHETPETDLLRRVLAQAGKGCVIAPGELRGPAIPRRAVT